MLSELVNFSSKAYYCKLNGIAVACDQNHAPGTQVDVQCQTGYTIRAVLVTPSKYTCLNTGRWNHQVYKCFGICGLQTPVGQQFIADGYKAGISEAPWNVAVYRNQELICGGTILTERIILSAAHCFCKNDSLGIINLL